MSAVAQPAQGTVTWSSDGALTYTPRTGARGVDTLAYTITGSLGSTSSTNVSINNGGSAGPIHRRTDAARSASERRRRVLRDHRRHGLGRPKKAFKDSHLDGRRDGRGDHRGGWDAAPAPRRVPVAPAIWVAAWTSPPPRAPGVRLDNGGTDPKAFDIALFPTDQLYAIRDGVSDVACLISGAGAVSGRFREAARRCRRRPRSVRVEGVRCRRERATAFDVQPWACLASVPAAQERINALALAAGEPPDDDRQDDHPAEPLPTL